MKAYLNEIKKQIKSVARFVRGWYYGMDYTEIIIRKRDRISERQHFKMIPHKGSQVYIEKGFRVFSGHHNIYLGSHISLVDTLINAGNNVGKITIDDYVFFGHGVCLLARGHDYNFFNEERHASITEKPIHIKEGAWIGTRAIVLGGVTIGKHSVVAAGSVVTQNVPDYAIVGGNPAKLIKMIPHHENM
ncbi:MAG: hypothetical protein M0P64_02530 [Candidatus Pacebacteria bacterium]|jgi:acetyltransferase-like isoleucine patch superfamily enzyme|nr:hypothetical protein [Candidatus Paceibacterota bacterium]